MGGVLPFFAAFAFLLSVPTVAAANPQDRISEIVPTPLEAWEMEGFRVQLRFGFESISLDTFRDYDPFFGENHFSLAVEPGVRMGRWWSLSSSLRYTVLANSEGLRWTTTVDATFHPVQGFFLAVGGGYGGMLGSFCTGSGTAFLARAGWLFPLGTVFSTGPTVQTDWQQATCESRFEKFELRQRSTNFAWSLAWR